MKPPAYPPGTGSYTLPHPGADPYAALFMICSLLFVWFVGLRGLRLRARAGAMALLGLALIPVYETTNVLALLRPLIPPVFVFEWYSSWFFGTITLANVQRAEALVDVEVAVLVLAACGMVAFMSRRMKRAQIAGHVLAAGSSVAFTLGLGVYLFLPRDFRVHVATFQSLFGLAPSLITNETLLFTSIGGLVLSALLISIWDRRALQPPFS